MAPDPENWGRFQRSAKLLLRGPLLLLLYSTAQNRKLLWHFNDWKFLGSNSNFQFCFGYLTNAVANFEALDKNNPTVSKSKYDVTVVRCHDLTSSKCMSRNYLKRDPVLKSRPFWTVCCATSLMAAPKCQEKEGQSRQLASGSSATLYVRFFIHSNCSLHKKRILEPIKL